MFEYVSLLKHGAHSIFDAHALPKRDAALDFRGRGLWVGIIPGSVLIPHPVDLDVVIIRGAFPGTNRSVIARTEKLFLHCFQRKVLIPFHDHAGVALCNHFSAPRCPRHFGSRRAKSLSTEYACRAELSRRQPREAHTRLRIPRQHTHLTISRKNSARMCRIPPEVSR
jgi:hypothetical protein